MLQKHSKDIIFILIILILIGIIWGVEKNIWIFIAISVVVVLVGLLYININDVSNQNNEKKYSQKEYYFVLKNIVNEEMNDILTDVDYDNFTNIKKGKEILKNFKIGDELDNVVAKIKQITSYDIEIYYLGLTAISLIDAGNLSAIDYEYVKLGKKLVQNSDKIKTKVTKFLKDAKL